MINKESSLRGVKAVSPLLLGIIPFGLISGITGANTGLSMGMSILMNLGVFAGASQLTALQLISINANILVIVGTALIINIRMMLYSLSIAPYFQNINIRWKALLSYMMTDQSYAISSIHFINNPDEDKKSFNFGSSISVWAVFQISALIGYLMGSIIPPKLGLDFAIPLTFIVILMKGVNSLPGVITIITSGIVAVVSSGLPMNLGLVLAIILGIAAGYISEKLFIKKGESIDG